MTVRTRVEISNDLSTEIFESYEYFRENNPEYRNISLPFLRRFISIYLQKCIDDTDWYQIWEEMEKSLPKKVK